MHHISVYWFCFKWGNIVIIISFIKMERGAAFRPLCQRSKAECAVESPSLKSLGIIDAANTYSK